MMKKVDPVEQMLDRLSELRGQRTPAAIEEFRRALKHRSNLIAAKAAKIVRELRITELLPDLIECFARFMRDPAKLDKRCAAVTEVVSALYEMDYLEPEIYIRGIRHVQLEASFGPPVDEAAKLRAQCALALVRTLHSEALPRVVDLLADPEPQARIGAIRALAACGGDKGALLLRFKARIGDREANVFGECLAGLLHADFDHSLELVRNFVDNEDDEIAEVTILTLGQQRRPEAFEILREKYERTVDRSLRKTLLTAMATARLDQATDYLIRLIGDAEGPTAAEVVKLLARFHNDQGIRERVKTAVDNRREKLLTEAFHQEF
jgi:HEAT repeat protein